MPINNPTPTGLFPRSVNRAEMFMGNIELGLAVVGNNRAGDPAVDPEVPHGAVVDIGTNGLWGIATREGNDGWDPCLVVPDYPVVIEFPTGVGILAVKSTTAFYAGDVADRATNYTYKASADYENADFAWGYVLNTGAIGGVMYVLPVTSFVIPPAA